MSKRSRGSDAGPPVDWSTTCMVYNNLGRSGLKVSALSLGAWVTYGGTHDDEVSYACMTAALRGGVNFFDNAEGYADGEAEKTMGRVIKRWETEGLCRREDLVISTKIFFSDGQGPKGNPNAKGLSRKHLIEGTRASLARLQMDHVDLLFCHRPDPSTPIEETVRTMDHLCTQGLAHYWGTSEWSAQELTEAHAVAARLGLIAPLMEQPQYNMLHRVRFEREYTPLFAQHGMGTTIWSPLASGLLSGKYSGGHIPSGSRLSYGGVQMNAELKRQFDQGEGLNGLDVKSPEEALRMVDELAPLAASLGCSLPQMALAWCLKNPNVSTVILGASRPEQVTENLKSLDVVPKLTTASMAEIDAVLKNKPASNKDWGRGPGRNAP